MSYTKLFDSITTSTVWLEPHHVLRVWIYMLAQKDADGVVEGSIPGLAHACHITIAECEEALAKFLAPDKYSRTKEHDGRRIVEVDGGWKLLNADKYRGKEDPEEHRAKEAARKARWRAQKEGKDEADVPSGPALSRDVPPSHAESRHTDTDAGSEITPVPDLPRPELPDPGAIVGAERDQGDEAPPGTHRKFLLPSQVPHVDREFSGKLSRLLTDSWQYALATHNQLRMAEGIDPHAQSWEALPSTQYPPFVSLREIATAELRAHGYERARERIRHRVDVAATSARRLDVRHLRWFTPSNLWDPKSFARDVEQSLAQAATSRGGPRPGAAPTNHRAEPERRPSKKLG